MSKITTDAQGRRYDADGKRVYDKAGANTWVEAVHPGTYPANHYRRPGDEPFQLKEGDSIVDWMREVEGKEIPTAANQRAKAKKATGDTKRENAPLNKPDDTKDDGTLPAPGGDLA